MNRMSKATPGPWITEKIDDSWQVTSPQIGARRFEVAYLGSENYAITDHAEREANARLIAATPDLYSAAKLALSALEYIPVPTQPDQDAIDALTAAIAKAEGKQAMTPNPQTPPASEGAIPTKEERADDMRRMAPDNLARGWVAETFAKYIAALALVEAALAKRDKYIEFLLTAGDEDLQSDRINGLKAALAAVEAEKEAVREYWEKRVEDAIAVFTRKDKADLVRENDALREQVKGLEEKFTVKPNGPPCPKCGFQITRTTREPFVIEGD